MKILHLSDFHLNQENLSDWENYIMEALLSLVKENTTKEDDFFILCTGDLIDKAGKEFKGVENALNIFKEKIIDPILQKLNLAPDRFIITPGNHDIDRDADDSIVNSGLRTEFSKETEGIHNINKYAKKILADTDKLYTKRMIAYKDFEKMLYSNCPNVKISFLGTSFHFRCGATKVCFNAINTSWLAYDDQDGKYGLAVSEPQYNQLREETKEADLRIALMHHPTDWLKFEKSTIAKWLYNDYTIMAVGHVHEADTSITTKLSGTLFTNVAPCFTNDIRSESKSFANGMTLIDYNPISRKIRCSYYIYKLALRKYVLNTEDVESGTLEKVIPSKNTNSIDGIVEHALDYIKTVHYPAIDEDIIPQKAKAISGLKEAYIHIPITRHGDENQELVELGAILNNSQHQMFFGSGDAGKTVLLYRLLMEFADNYQIHNLIPIYINFDEIENREILSIIKEYIDCNSNEAKEVLKAKKIILLVDNYTVSEESKYKKQRIKQFLKDNEVRLIATSINSISRVLPTAFIEHNSIAFEYFYIEQFKTENIKQLMARWSPDDESLTRNTKIEKMVSNFCSYSLPCTAMSVSLYLWSTENTNRDPVNQAVLLDIYIEIILEKLSKENIYHNTFDYKNKTMLLAYLAKYMHDNQKDFFTFGKLTDKISEYLNKVGFKTFDANKLAEYFVKRKIFTLKDNIVGFAHSCFYYFFLARRMEDDKDFYNQVVNVDNFYKYDRVINCYAGLVRRDDHLINVLYTEFKKYFAPAQPIYNEINSDEFFTIVTTQKKDFVPAIEKMDMKRAVAEKPIQEVVEKRIQEVTDERLSKITDKVNNNPTLTADQFIVIMCHVLRNLDGIEDVKLKTEIYSEIIRNTLIFSISMKNKLAIYANKHQGKLPESYSNVKNIELFFRFMPYAIQTSLHEFMGTTKLCQVFENKLIEDFKNNRCDVEKFISLGLLWDTNNLANIKLMKKFIKTVGKNSARDYVLVKLYWNYMSKVKSGSQEEVEYISLLSQLKSKQYSLPFLHHKLINDDLKKEKRNREERNSNNCLTSY